MTAQPVCKHNKTSAECKECFKFLPMKNTKIIINTIMGSGNPQLSFERDITFELASAIILLITEHEERDKCPYKDCYKVHYSNCPTHGNQ